MSGAGVKAGWAGLTAEELFQAGRVAERADALAYMRRRKTNAETMARRSAEFAAQGQDRARQIDIIIGDLAGGMHAGEFEVEARTRARADEMKGRQ